MLIVEIVEHRSSDGTVERVALFTFVQPRTPTIELARTEYRVRPVGELPQPRLLPLNP